MCLFICHLNIISVKLDIHDLDLNDGFVGHIS